jgi:hypothetical protein
VFMVKLREVHHDDGMLRYFEQPMSSMYATQLMIGYCFVFDVDYRVLLSKDW